MRSTWEIQQNLRNYLLPIFDIEEKYKFENSNNKIRVKFIHIKFDFGDPFNN